MSLSQKRALIVDCKEIGFSWWVDKLDCSLSSARQKVDMSFEEIIEKLEDSSYFTIIDRKPITLDTPKHFEIIFRTMTAIDYFLWIWVEDEKMSEIIKKHNLLPYNNQCG